MVGLWFHMATLCLCRVGWSWGEGGSMDGNMLSSRRGHVA